MREIKFRLWSKKHKCYYYYSLRNLWEVDSEPTQSFNDLVFMQYTGLKDKSGKEIYEGDVIIIPNGLSAMESLAKGEGTYVIAEVFFDDGCWTTKDYNETKDFLWDVCEDCEIIGNIYEHLEFLDKEVKR